MASCCQDKSCEIEIMRQKHGRVLWVVFAINAAMFFVEGIAGLLAHSTSLLADALDMLGDTLVYGFSLFVLARSIRWQAIAALIKGVFMLLFGIGVLAEACYKLLFDSAIPDAETIGIVGGLALTANIVCFILLSRHRDDNLNMASTWLCSRNDLIANLGVLLAAATCYQLNASWPDILVGTVIAALFVMSAKTVLQQAIQALRISSSTPVTVILPK